jgi:hypothetical protein
VFLAFVVGIHGAAPGPARAAQVTVDAPPSCLDSETLAEEVAELVGKPLAAVPDVDFQVEIAERPRHGWRLRLKTLDSRRGTDDTSRVRGTREIDGVSCTELADAAAVAISVSVRSIDDERATAPIRPTTISPARAATAAPAPPAVAHPPPSEGSWRPVIVLAFAADSGALPKTGLGVDLEGHLQRGAFRLALLGTIFGSEETSGTMNGGGTFRLLLGGVLGCWGPQWGRWTPVVCGGGEIGRLSGTGTGVPRPETGDTLWRAARSDLGISAAVGGTVAFVLRAGLVVPLSRPAFVLDRSELVYRPSRMTARLTMGLELAF